MNKLYWHIRWTVSRYPLILFFIRCFPGVRHTVVTRRTDILIEGYPRSGNTFARNAFLMSCNDELVVSSHLHFIANVRQAISLNKPILILIREPVDAIASYLVYQGPNYPVDQAIREYIDFYTFILNQRQSVITASFEEVTGSFGQVIDRVNKRFGTAYPLFEHTPENVKFCKDLAIGQVSPWRSSKKKWTAERNASSPVSGREALKDAEEDRLCQPEYRDRLDQARELFRALV